MYATDKDPPMVIILLVEFLCPYINCSIVGLTTNPCARPV
jgi:hypothetical protein